MTVASLTTRPLTIQVLAGQGPQAKRAFLLEASLEQDELYPQQSRPLYPEGSTAQQRTGRLYLPPRWDDKPLGQLQGEDQFLNEIIGGRRVKEPAALLCGTQGTSQGQA